MGENLNVTNWNQVSSPSTGSCPVCRSAEAGEAISKSFGGVCSTWLRCRRCGTLYIWPLPTPVELSQYYRTSYADRQSPGSVSHRYRFSETNKETIFREYQLSLADIKLPSETLLRKRILDYGCANGFFLDYCAGQGCLKEHLFGFDIAEDLLARVIDKGYRILDTDGDSFDFIFLWDVLEHISAPATLLARLKNHLTVGGTIVVQTPRIGLLADTLRESWEHFLPFEHVVLYTRESVVHLFGEAGFHLAAVSSFGANAPAGVVPEPYKRALDKLAKETDNGSTQVARFVLQDISQPGAGRCGACQ